MTEEEKKVVDMLIDFWKCMAETAKRDVYYMHFAAPILHDDCMHVSMECAEKAEWPGNGGVPNAGRE